jgi:DNA replication protein DnaC
MKDTTPLESMLKSFYLSAFVQHFEDFAKRAEKQKLPHIDYLYQLAQVETQDRLTKRTARLLRQAKLPLGKLLDDLDLSRQPRVHKTRLRELAEGNFLDNCENLLVFGNCGTGKTHLVAALGREWCLRGRRVLFTSAAALVQNLLASKRNLSLNEFIKQLDKYEALIIDDISYIPQTRDETDVLFVLLAERYESRSVVITSNLPFSQWDTIFKDPITANAAVDRLVHHSIILELAGNSHRQTEAKRKRQAEDKALAPVE